MRPVYTNPSNLILIVMTWAIAAVPCTGQTKTCEDLGVIELPTDNGLVLLAGDLNPYHESEHFRCYLLTDGISIVLAFAEVSSGLPDLSRVDSLKVVDLWNDVHYMKAGSLINYMEGPYTSLLSFIPRPLRRETLNIRQISLMIKGRSYPIGKTTYPSYHHLAWDCYLLE